MLCLENAILLHTRIILMDGMLISSTLAAITFWLAFDKAYQRECARGGRNGIPLYKKPVVLMTLAACLPDLQWS